MITIELIDQEQEMLVKFLCSCNPVPTVRMIAETRIIELENIKNDNKGILRRSHYYRASLKTNKLLNLIQNYDTEDTVENYGQPKLNENGH